jgi:hypothetical protein
MRLPFCLDAKQEGVIERIAKFNRSRNTASQIGDSDSVRNNRPILEKMAPGSECNIDDAGVVSKTRAAFEEYEMSVPPV